MLPHLAGRPLFVTRFPNGVDGEELLSEALGGSAAVRAHGVDLVQPQRAATATISSARTSPRCSGSARWRRSSCTPGSPARSRRPTRCAPGRKFTGSEAALDRSVLNYPDFIVFDLDPYLYSGKEARGRGARAAPTGLQPHPRARAPDPRDARPPGARDLHQDLGPHRTPPVPPDRPRSSTSTRRAGWRRRSGGTSSAERPEGGDASSGRWSSGGEDLLRLQPEHPRQVAGGALLAPAACGRHGVDAGILGRAGRVYPTDFTLRPCPSGWRPAAIPGPASSRPSRTWRRARSARRPDDPHPQGCRPHNARLRYRAQPGWMPPMLATLADAPPPGAAGSTSPSWTASGCWSTSHGGKVRLLSRNRKPLEGGLSRAGRGAGDRRARRRGARRRDRRHRSRDRAQLSFSRLQQRMQLRDAVRARAERRRGAALPVRLPVLRGRGSHQPAAGGPQGGAARRGLVRRPDPLHPAPRPPAPPPCTATPAPGARRGSSPSGRTPGTSAPAPADWLKIKCVRSRNS